MAIDANVLIWYARTFLPIFVETSNYIFMYIAHFR